jgi:hypothetical protein
LEIILAMVAQGAISRSFIFYSGAKQGRKSLSVQMVEVIAFEHKNLKLP